jgi:hypothetical protein
MLFPSQILKSSVLKGRDDKEYGIKFIEFSGWEGNHRYEFGTFIFEYKDKYYAVEDSIDRMDYNINKRESIEWFGDINCKEVEKRPITVCMWMPVMK